MKRFILLLFLITVVMPFAIAQQGINYKAIISDDAGNVLASTPISVQYTILQDGTTEVYKESHNPTTDANGIIVVNIGEGTLISGDFDAIDWGSAPHFLKTEIDKGEGYVDLGTTEFKIVPYALHARTAENVTGTSPATPNLADVLAAGNEANSQIKNVSDPTENQDAATKAYVDAFQPQITALADRVAVLEGIVNGDIVTDADGNIYSVVEIGSQVWMAENLKTTKYNDGTLIPQVTDNAEWTNLTTPGYCWYNNDRSTFGDTYGALYNWHTVNSGNLCPAGWHVPTDAEWTMLTTYLGGENVAGGKLKETGTTHWSSPNTGATNETGFTAVPGGFRDNYNGNFSNIGHDGFWWSATEFNNSTALNRRMYSYSSNVNRSSPIRQNGYSVRCLKN